MRNKDRDMSSTDMDSRTNPNWSGNIASDSSEREDRLHNREDEHSPDIDEEEEDQERQREGNLGNERVRQSER
jgi:hypothetical protein